MYLKSFFFISFFILFSSATAFNITQVLGQYSDFSTFNGYLTSTQLAADINTRRTITVLVVDNGDLSQLSGKSLDVIKKIISLHVILDYFDTQKFQKLPSGSAILTTLFQASGQANGQLGFLNVTDSSGTIMFGSAVRGAPLGANLVNSVASQPYNLSVLRISDVIIPPGVDNSTPSHSPPPPPPPPQTPSSSPPAPAPVPTPRKPPPPTKSPAPSPKMSPPPSNPPPPKMSPPPSSSPPPSNAPSPSKSPSPAPSQSSSPPPSPTRATPPSPTRSSPPRPALAPRPANRPAPSHPPVDAPADGPTPAASPRHHPPADESGVPATVGIQLAVVIMLVSSFWSLISCI